jgi:hypothetical protein
MRHPFPETPAKRHSTPISVCEESGSSGRQEFVAIDASGDTVAPVVGFHSQDTGVTANVNVAG